MTTAAPSIPVTRTTTPRFSETLRDSAAFGAVFSDHVLVADYADGAWGEPAIVPYGPMTLPPAPLAAHYGLSAPQGWTKVSVDPKTRGGILTHASVLTVTSHADQTSPVRRGKWVLAQLLCSEPPPPPPEVDELPPPSATSGTKRDQMAAHRSDPSCSGCHQAMDPIGLSLEAFDPVGLTRTVDEFGFTIDPSGELPTGEKFSGEAELSSILKNDPRFDPYAAVGVGLYWLTEGSVGNSTGGLGLGAQLGLGFDFYITDTISTGFQGMFRSIGLITNFGTPSASTAIFPFSLQGNVAFHF